MVSNKTARDRGKNAERWLAKQVGGKRLLRKGEQVADVETDFAIYEVKERTKISDFLLDALRQAEDEAKPKGKTPVFALTELGHKNNLVILRLEEWLEITGG